MTLFDASAPLLPEIIALHGKWKAGKIAVISQDEHLTWRELDEASNRIANGLLANGIGPGSMVGLIMKNGRQMVEAFIGIMKSGAASVPINLSVSDEALNAMFQDAAVETAIATVDQLRRLDAFDVTDFKIPPIVGGGGDSGSEPDQFEAFKRAYPADKQL
ncbi:MAG: AMP-binding protein [Kordiimonadaceae bacterium]|nr:AMP-binding protein [Kordiimonadaceae bacterium]